MSAPPTSDQHPESTDVIFVDNCFREDFLLSLRRLRQSEQLTDVTLKAGDVLLPCHRVVLAAASPYFNTMFTSGFLESSSPTVEIRSTDSRTLQIIIDYIYSAKVILTTENVENLFRVSSEYQFDRLKDACEEFMIQHLTPISCVGFNRLAKLFDLAVLEEETRIMMCREFEYICEKDLMEMTEAELVDYISDPSLLVLNEDPVFDAVKTWVYSDRGNRCVAFERIMAHVRLSFCSSTYLLDVVQNEQLMSGHVCQKYLKEARELQSLPKHQQERSDERLIPRKCFNVQRRLIVVGGITEEHNGNKECYYFKEETDMWCSLTDPIPIRNRRFFSICVIESGLLLTGGGDRPEGSYGGDSAVRDCWLFDKVAAKWKVMPKMTEARFNHASVAHGDHVYVVGGECGSDKAMNSVEYLEKRNQWKKVEPMMKKLTCPATVSFGSGIYVFGGNEGDSVFGRASKATQMYDEICGQWALKAEMPDNYSFGGAAVNLNDKIFVMGGYIDSGACLCYNPGLDTWTVLTAAHHDHCSAPAVLWKGKILVAGGENTYVYCGDDFLNSIIEEYDHETDSWRTWDIALPQSLSNHSLYSMDIPEPASGP